MKQNKTQLSFKLAGLGMTTLIAFGLYANANYTGTKTKNFDFYSEKPVVTNTVKPQDSIEGLLQDMNPNVIFENNYYAYREKQVEERKAHLREIKVKQIKDRQEKERIEKECKEKERKEQERLELEHQKKLQQLRQLQQEQQAQKRVNTQRTAKSNNVSSNTNYSGKSYKGFNPNNLLMPSNVSKESLKRALRNYDKANYVDAYIDAEQQYGVNSLFLVAVSVMESGWNDSALAKTSNNLTSIAGGRKHFDSGYDCITQTAKLLRNNYLVQSGKYYHGNSVKGVNYYYCVLDDGHTPNYAWADNVVRIANIIASRL